VSELCICNWKVQCTQDCGRYYGEFEGHKFICSGVIACLCFYVCVRVCACVGVCDLSVCPAALYEARLSRQSLWATILSQVLKLFCRSYTYSSLQCIFCTVHYIQCITHSVLQRVHYIQSITHSVLQRVHYVQCITHSAFRTVYYAQCVMHSALHKVHFIQCITHSALRTVHYMKCISYSALHTVHYIQCTCPLTFHISKPLNHSEV